MINIVHFSYVPNTASTNRLEAYLRNLPQDTFVRVFFIMPDSKKSRMHDVPENVSVVYCWDKYSTKIKILKYLILYLSIRYVRSLVRPGDIVYCYNAPSYMKSFYNKNVKLYAEKTEHPEVTVPESRMIKQSLQSHLRMCRNLDGLFVISTALKDYYISKGVEESKIHIINMVVNPDRFIGLKKEPQKNRYIAYCGTVSNNKDGVDKLIKAFAIVSRKYPDVLLYIIGKAPSSLEDNENVLLARSLGVLDKIKFTGVISAAEMPQVLKNATVLALNRPNSLQAQCGFPTKLGEYLLTENLVVVTRVGDIPQFLVDEETALLSSPDDDEAFAKKVLWALEHPYEAELIGKNGARIAMRYFNAKVEVIKMLNCMLN